jgi:hypothetical protein
VNCTKEKTNPVKKKQMETLINLQVEKNKGVENK